MEREASNEEHDFERQVHVVSACFSLFQLVSEAKCVSRDHV